ncbi:tripartite tricarboxylate transporter substrate binding protein [Roseomonas frigidaquae]|uniref:Tripartite tricarboxylate transporter substrate binding protein n=1 Tax=Falsiroseomonas frigidaquae TaxID=487318 RepID=A0ABX1F3U9_9PROT|nr:tripartite tricarboxylate transporter substrate binding protein [Falsiroseomonas frigidaquae]NKE47043.1 tripartite tricarboxylate transporter substrate binding protein [Falsiroseomonas frigidaquae]
MIQRRALFAATAGLALAAPAIAETWPSRPVRLVIPYPPGGGTDIAGRILGNKFAQILGQAVVIENRGGAGGMIGTRAVGQAPPDGYTLLFNGTVSILRDNFDPRSVVDHVVRVAATHNILVVNQTIPARTVPEFIAYVKANPGKVNHGTSGPLASQHLAAVMFDLMAGTRIENVHYRGTGPSVVGILGNEVQMMFGSMSAVLPLIQDGKLRALATASAQRSRMLPDLPTVGEFLPGYGAELTYSLCTPIGASAELKRRLEQMVKVALEDEALVAEMGLRGFEPQYEIGDSLKRSIELDMARWVDVANRAGLTLS